MAVSDSSFGSGKQMITRIHVDGFKSLSDFSLDFAPGLNILVGPNGSGKTNIVSFFEFLAHLMETDASEATSRVGGVGAIFRRVKSDEYEKEITAEIWGCAISPREYARRGGEQTEPVAYYLYHYSFSLLFPASRDAVLFERQRLRLRRSAAFESQVPPDTKWGVDIDVNLESDAGPIATIRAFDDSLLDLRYYPAKRTGKVDARREVESVLSRMLANNGSLVTVVSRYTPEMWAMGADISGGQIYNIVPSRVKMSEDSAKPPGIARDGSGLAATLHALQRSMQSFRFSGWNQTEWHRRQTFSPSALTQLKAYLQLVNTSVEDIDVWNDRWDNQLRVSFKISSGNYRASIPLALMSDGTLKWVALVTAALTAQSVFSIEEPENYLHPQMQGQIVTILREILFRDETNRFTLMTTHSETLLNHCRPEELIIVSMANGKSVAKRSSNAAEVSDEISRTGFGLGYYFVTNALRND
jgi:predicted ATPase